MLEASEVAVQVEAVLKALRRDYELLRTQLQNTGAPRDRVLTADHALRILPAPVVVHHGPDLTLIAIQLAGGTGGVSFDTLDAAGEMAMSARNENWEMLRDDASHTIWVALRSGDDVSGKSYLVRTLFEGGLDLLVAADVERAKTATDRSYREFGYHPLDLPLPDGSPDERWQLMVRLTANGPQSVTLAHLVEQTKRMAVITAVPLDVESLLRQARLLYLYGWQRWEFFAIAEQQALFALQASAETLYDAWLVRSGRPFIGQAGDGQRVSLDDVTPRRWALVRESDRRRLRRVTAAGKPIPRTAAQLPEAMQRAGLMSRWESAVIGNYFAMRNDFAHPSFAQSHLDTWAADLLERVAGLINAMWYRWRVDPVPDPSCNPLATA